VPGACAFDLQVANCSLRVDCCEREIANFGRRISQAVQRRTFARGGLAHQTNKGISRHVVVTLSRTDEGFERGSSLELLSTSLA